MGAGASFVAGLIGRAVELPPSVAARFPELGGARWRRGGLPVRIAAIFMGAKPVAAITLWRTVFLAPTARLDEELLLHELRHVHQFQTSFAFPLLYLWDTLRRGYHRNRFEVDAREYAARRLRADGVSQA